MCWVSKCVELKGESGGSVNWSIWSFAENSEFGNPRKFRDFSEKFNLARNNSPRRKFRVLGLNLGVRIGSRG